MTVGADYETDLLLLETIFYQESDELDEALKRFQEALASIQETPVQDSYRTKQLPTNLPAPLPHQ
jgi:hypothetical protein